METSNDIDWARGAVQRLLRRTARELWEQGRAERAKGRQARAAARRINRQAAL